jgi:hypothetical protein
MTDNRDYGVGNDGNAAAEIEIILLTIRQNPDQPPGMLHWNTQ